MSDEHIYRSITLIVQNDTHAEFLVDGHATIHGEWESEPKSGDVVKPQSTAKWRIVSHTEQQGASGFVHLTCNDGDIKISVGRPWAGELRSETQLPKGYAAQTQVDDENPDHPVVVVEIRTAAQK
jgi:hypothetical protein